MADADPNGRKVTAVKLYGGWVKAGSATTVGKLVDRSLGDEKAYLGAAAGPELFTEMLSALLKAGPTIGFQREPGGLDTVVTVASPLTGDGRIEIFRCFGELTSNISKPLPSR